MKNSEIKTQKNAGKKESAKTQIDNINLEKIKINLEKGDKKLLSKEGKMPNQKNLYKLPDGLGIEEQKKFRSKIRRKIASFCNDILGKDRKDEERKESVKKFMTFYKENWKIQDFKIENFSQSKDEDQRKDIIDLLKYTQGVISK